MTHRFQKAATLEEHVKKVLEQASGSVLHHWVPQFLLRQFTDEPQAENPAIWCMPVDGDQPRLSCVHDECAIKGHNLLVESADLPKTAIEGLYGYVEVRRRQWCGRCSTVAILIWKSARPFRCSLRCKSNGLRVRDRIDERCWRSYRQHG
jgi:hypothetical protein